MTDKQKTDDPLIGKIIAGRYEIIELIGSGGQGSVYKARQLSLNRIIALKILRPDYIEDEKIAARFHREAEITSRLDHPNIVRAFDHGKCKETNVVFIAMDYVPGAPLKELIKLAKERTDPSHTLEVERSINIVIQLCKGIYHAHEERGVLHRDIKPGNILLANYDNNPDFVKITDFGIAKILIESEGLKRLTKTEAGGPSGTCLYMAPEQFQEGYNPSFSLDVYSIGCVLFELLTGNPPFNGGLDVITINMHATASIPDLKLDSVEPVIRSRLATIVTQALAKEPSMRYQNVTELLTDLEEVQLRLRQLRVQKTNPVILFIERVGLFLYQIKSRLLSNVVLSPRLKSRLGLIILGLIVLFVSLLIGAGVTGNALTAVYLPDGDLQMLNQEIEIHPLVYKQTKPAEMDASTSAQLALLGDGKIRSQLSRAQSYRNQGNLNAAIIEYRDTLNSADRLNLLHKEIGAQIMSELSLCYLFVGNLTEAKEFSEKALSILQELGYSDSIKALLPSLVKARALTLSKNDSAATAEFQHMQRTLYGADIKRRFDQVAYSESFLADFFRKQKKSKLAEPYYKAAEEHWAGFQEDGSYNRSAVLDQLGLLLASNNNLVLAKETLRNALASLQTSSDKTKLAQAKLAFHLSQVNWDLHDFISALLNRSEAKQLLKQ